MSGAGNSRREKNIKRCGTMSRDSCEFRHSISAGGSPLVAESVLSAFAILHRGGDDNKEW